MLNSTILGDGPPLIILHGLFGQAKNWGGIGKDLARDFTVHALDLRNHGQSPRADDMRYLAMAADVQHYMAVHDIDRPAILGHSMGGKVAMMLALNDGDAVGALIIADIAPVTYAHDFSKHFAAIAGLDLAAINNRQDADQAMAGSITDPGVRAFLLSNLVRDNEQGWRWLINHPAIHAHMADITAWPDKTGQSYDGPALFLRGANSDYVMPSMESGITALFPHAQQATIDQAGHWLHADQPAAFTKACRDFLIG